MTTGAALNGVKDGNYLWCRLGPYHRMVWVVTGAVLVAMAGTSCDLRPVRHGNDAQRGEYAQVTSKPLREIALPNQDAFSLAFHLSPTSREALYASMFDFQGTGTRQIRVLDLQNGRTSRAVKQRLPFAQCVAFFQGGRTGVSGHMDGALYVWDLSTGAVVWHTSGDGKPIRAVACPPTGLRFVYGSEGGDIVLAGFTGEWGEIRRFEGHSYGIRHNCLVWVAGTGKFLSGSWDGSTCLWDAQSGRREAHFNPGYGRVVSVAASPDARYAISSYLGGPRLPAILWDLSVERELRRFDMPEMPRHTGSPVHVVAADFSPDGKTALLGLTSGTVVWLGVPSFRLLATRRLYQHSLVFAAFSLDGKMSVSVGCDNDPVKEDAAVRFWQLTAEEE